MFAFNALWIATGVFLSLWLRKVTLAVIINLLLALFAYLGVLMLLVIFSEVPRLVRELILGGVLVVVVPLLAVMLTVLVGRMVRRRPGWPLAARLAGAAALAVLLVLTAMPLGRILLHVAGDRIDWDRMESTAYNDDPYYNYYDDNDLPELVGWYAPYYHLAQWVDWDADNHGPGVWTDKTFDLPGYRTNVTAVTYLSAVFFVGCVHLFAAWLLLTVTSLGFDRVVGRAAQTGGSTTEPLALPPPTAAAA
jgi:hypothetical protein